MFVHIYRQNETDMDGLHQSVSRITMKNYDSRLNINEPSIILGTLPNTTVIKMKDIRWFWVEED